MRLELDEIAGPVLIVSPHPDDETLGCGGLIAALCERGVAVHTVFVTDGGASHRNSAEWPRGRIAALRETEGLAALAILGAEAQPHSFMHLPDAAMPEVGSAAYQQARTQAVELIRNLQPVLVVLPWRRDPHCDHRDAWSLFTDALAQAGVAAERLEYAIWLDELGSADDHPLPGEVERLELDIAGHVGLKRRAIAAHGSQLGGVINDDPEGFYLTEHTLDRLIQPVESYWRPCRAA